MKRSYWEDIVDFGCDDCGEAHLEPVYLHCRMHTDRPTQAFVDRAEGVAAVRCSACNSPLLALGILGSADSASSSETNAVICPQHRHAGSWTKVDPVSRVITIECGACRAVIDTALVAYRPDVE